MINGEGTGETSSQVPTPDPLDEFLSWQGPNLDGGDLSPVSSRYSSCGESEFERYCSANSVMGTPSLCSSVGTYQECIDSDLGSVRSFRIGDDNSGLENFSLGGRVDRKCVENKPSYLDRPGGCQRIESCDGKSDLEEGNIVVLGQGLVGNLGIENGLNLNDYTESSSSYAVNRGDACDTMLKVGSRLELPVFSDLNVALDEGLFGEDDVGGVITWRGGDNSEEMRSSFENKSTQEKANAEPIDEHMLNLGVEEGFESRMDIEQVDGCLEGLNLQSGMEFDGREDLRCSDEGETSSRYEHSEGEDSMFGCGTDDEKPIDFYHGRNIQYAHKDNGKYENSLLMTSSIAFGSDDWDDYLQETRENPLVSMVPDELRAQKQQSIKSERDNLHSTFATTTFPSIGLPEQLEDAIDIPVACNQVQDANELALYDETLFGNSSNLLKFGEVEQGEKVRDMPVTTNQVGGFNDPAESLETCSASNIFEREEDPLAEEAHLKEVLNIRDGGLEREHQYTRTEDVTGIDDDHVSESIELEKTKLQLDPLSDITGSQFCSASREVTEDRMEELLKDQKSYLLPSLMENNTKRTMEDSPVSFNLFEGHPTPIKTENLELNEFYDEVVHEMEEILLDSGESPGARFTKSNRKYQSQLPLPLRDGGSTASISGTDDAYPLIQRPLKIDGVEVVGARQKKGDVSLSERLVGVKEYTVYIIRVWNGEDHWEVERRYRDFCTLYRRLKELFANQGWILPSPWSSVERESRKIFGNASPDVIAERSVLIQECLQSVLHARVSSSPPNALVWFLYPSEAVPSSLASGTGMPQSPFSTRGSNTESVSTLGKTISLFVEIQPYKSTKQTLEAQHYTCAGCHKHFDDGKTRMQELVQTLGWGKPRLCEYSGQLFCSSCHTNETAVLPARVLHLWDFTPYPVSQLAKSYLDSIHDQPMLCVSAVNPFLFSKVPALQHVTNVRKKIGAMLPYVRCPFRRTIYRGLGSRIYLIESYDFFGLRDLIDLSRGVFAALPVMVETVLRKILEHITEQCLICCDVGVPCNARQACDDPSSLIFPFQEGEVERCRSCQLVFHKACLKRLTSCTCGARLKLDETKMDTTRGNHSVGTEVDGTLGLLGRKADSKSSVGFLSGLFSRARPEKLWEPRDSETVILMGSLPSTSL